MTTLPVRNIWLLEYNMSRENYRLIVQEGSKIEYIEGKLRDKFCLDSLANTVQ